MKRFALAIECTPFGVGRVADEMMLAPRQAGNTGLTR
jgi:hypothetical protein